MQGEAAVPWVRSVHGTSRPYLVNRPQPYFLEYETAAPGSEIRVFGHNLCRAFFPRPKPRVFLVARAGHVLAGLERREAHPGVVGNRGVDMDNIHVAVLEQRARNPCNAPRHQSMRDEVDLFLVPSADRVAVDLAAMRCFEFCDGNLRPIRPA